MKIICGTCGKVHTEREERLMLLSRRLSYQFQAELKGLVEQGLLRFEQDIDIWVFADRLGDLAAKNTNIVFDDYVKGRKRKPKTEGGKNETAER